MVQISKSHLIFGDHHNMLCLTALPAVRSPYRRNIVIDLTELLDTFFLKHLSIAAHNQAAGDCIISRSMVIKFRQIQSIRNQIQLIPL